MAETSSNSPQENQRIGLERKAKELIEAVEADEVRHGGLLSRATLLLASELRLVLAKG